MTSIPAVAVPVSVMVQEVSPGAVALPWALHAIAVGVVNEPCAVPVSLRSPAHVALKVPFAAVAVCSETVQLKSVHVLGVGISDPDVQLPISELLPADVGDVAEL